MAEKQTTIQESVTITGAGLHTGQEVTVRICPASENHGYKFKRVDIEEQPIIEADVDYVANTSRGTTLEKNGVSIKTVEHILAALAGLQIDNALIELNCSELPILDGSSKLYVDALLQVGTVELEAEREYYEITSNITFYDPENEVEIMAIPSSEYRISTLIDYNTEVLGTQHASIASIKEFPTAIAPCRTFVFLHELEYLLANNLIKGGDLSNAIVFVNKQVKQEELDRLADLFNKPKIEVTNAGVLNNIDLYFSNEAARHKLLDIVGDLTLFGKPIKGHIIAKKPGHKVNVAFAKMLKEQYKKDKQKIVVPAYDPNQKPVYDINQIKNILPHRPPFLLVDKIIKMDSEQIVGIKNVTMNEGFFVGHFPDEPVMPGVLQIEALAQTGGIFVLSFVDEPERYSTYFMKISEAKFKQKVVPGDTLIFRLTLLSPIRRGLCHMQGTAYVGDKIVSEAELLAQIVKNK